MKPAAKLCALALCLVAWAGGAAAQMHEWPGSRYVANGWVGAAMRNDSDQRFAYCMVTAPNVGNTQLVFLVSAANEFTLAITNTAWRLTANQELPVAWWIDNGERLTTNARAISNNLIHIDLVDTAEVFERFRAGLQFTVLAEGRTMQFSLRGTSVALDRLRDCYHQYRGRGGPVQPADSRPPQGQGGASAQRQGGGGVAGVGATAGRAAGGGKPGGGGAPAKRAAPPDALGA